MFPVMRGSEMITNRKMGLGYSTFPAPPLGAVTSRVAKIQAIRSQMEVSARCLPGQIRRPKPNTKSLGSIIFLRRSSLMFIYRSGSNSSGRGKSSGLRDIALEILGSEGVTGRGESGNVPDVGEDDTTFGNTLVFVDVVFHETVRKA